MVRFTKHALEKFQILEAHGFKVTARAVERTVRMPELVDTSRLPLMIAQRNFDKTHVLRVVYKEEYGVRIVITFYPGRRSNYEKK